MKSKKLSDFINVIKENTTNLLTPKFFSSYALAGMPNIDAMCGSGLSCSGGGGQCGSGLDCGGSGSGGYGLCGAGLDCSGGGGQCGSGLGCGGS